MKRIIMALAVISCCACASARDEAVAVTNTAQSVLTSVDQVWAPIVQEQIAKAQSLDDAGYKRHMSPYLVVQEAIEQARRVTQLLNLAVQTWDAQHDNGGMFYEVLPCAVQDLQLIRALLHGHEAQAPPQLEQALSVLEATLGAFARAGTPCVKTGGISAPKNTPTFPDKAPLTMTPADAGPSP